MTRDKVLDLLYSADTLKEIAAARAARADYLREHPNDEEIIEMGEMLHMLQTAIETTRTREVERVA